MAPEPVADRPDPGSDGLTEILDALRISTTLYARAEVTPPWGVSFPAAASGYFHLVEDGGCWLRTSGDLRTCDEQPCRMGPGDVVLLPHGTAHRLTSGADGPVFTEFDPVGWLPTHRAHTLEPVPDSVGTGLICGSVHVANPSVHPLFTLLPAIVHVRAESAAATDIAATLRLLASEATARRPGSASVLRRLADVVLVQILRDWISRDPAGRPGWPTALRDPQVGAAVAAIHTRPAEPWTVERLAAVAGMSRSRFAERFTALVGVPPLTYLTTWRMDRAAALLRDTPATVREVARAVGYGSEPAFSRAFTRHHHLPPARARQPALRL